VNRRQEKKGDVKMEEKDRGEREYNGKGRQQGQMETVC
jgi:hypothetical protein